MRNMIGKKLPKDYVAFLLEYGYALSDAYCQGVL